MSNLTNGATADRDAHGRFRPGHCLPGPGNPRMREASQYRRAISEAATPDRVGEVIARLMQQAMEGDSAAAKVVLDRVLGRAREELPAEQRMSVVFEVLAQLRRVLRERYESDDVDRVIAVIQEVESELALNAAQVRIHIR